jgi:hypothetical protein
MTQKIIYATPEGGVAVVHPTGEVPINELVSKVVPAGADFEIVSESAIPSDRFFRNAWVKGDCCVEQDLDKCKDIGHDLRRAARAEEFKPFDEVIAKQIPGADATAAEEARQQIRDKYALVQDVIEGATTPDEIKTALEANQ